MPGSRIVVVADALLRDTLDALAAELALAGHEVRRLRDSAPDAAALRGARILVATGRTRLDRAALVAADALEAVVYPTIGTDGLDMAAASELGILVANGAVPQNVSGMAEATIVLLGALLHGLPAKMAQMQDGLPWRRPPVGTGLAGKTVGLIGLGRIGRAVAARLAGWEVRLLATARGAADPPPGVTLVPLDRLLAESDAVSLHATAARGAPPILGPAEVRAMRRGAVLVNTARGALVDEAALAAALAAGHLAGAALDVFATEPLPAESPLRGLPNVILTPHNAGHTKEAIAAILPAAHANIAAILRGDLPPLLRNHAAIAAWPARRARLAAA